MAFPTSPSNNDVHKEGNRAFVYDSTLGTWDQVKETDRTENKILQGEIGGGTIGSGVTFPVGHVLQVQHTHKLDTLITYQATQENGIYVPNLNVDITPASTSNKILVMVELNVATEHQGNGLQMWVDKNLAKVTNYAGAANGSRGRVITGAYAWGDSSQDVAEQSTQMTGSFVDTPASTATLNYAVVLRVKNTNTWFYVNRLETDSDNADHPRMASSIIAMEIQG